MRGGGNWYCVPGFAGFVVVSPDLCGIGVVSPELVSPELPRSFIEILDP